MGIWYSVRSIILALGPARGDYPATGSFFFVGGRVVALVSWSVSGALGEQLDRGGARSAWATAGECPPPYPR